jgi:hypothetical protein
VPNHHATSGGGKDAHVLSLGIPWRLSAQLDALTALPQENMGGGPAAGGGAGRGGGGGGPRAARRGTLVVATLVFTLTLLTTGGRYRPLSRDFLNISLRAFLLFVYAFYIFDYFIFLYLIIIIVINFQRISVAPLPIYFSPPF